MSDASFVFKLFSVPDSVWTEKIAFSWFLLFFALNIFVQIITVAVKVIKDEIIIERLISYDVMFWIKFHSSYFKTFNGDWQASASEFHFSVCLVGQG